MLSILYLTPMEYEHMQVGNMLCQQTVEHTGGYCCILIDPIDEAITQSLAHLLIQLYEKQFLRELLMEKYFFAEGAELEEVLRYAQFLLNNGDIFEEVDITEINRERIMAISHDLRDYMQEHDRLHLQGFFLFRLKKIWMSYERIVENAIDEYMLVKEYRDDT